MTNTYTSPVVSESTAAPLVASAPTFGWGFDCLAENVQHLLGAKPTAIWPYDTGTNGIPWTQEEISHFVMSGTRRVFRVNQGFQQGPAAALHGDEFDLEAGAWTIPALVDVVRERRRVKWATHVYCTWSDYGLMKEALAEADITQASMWYRIADWNLIQHFADVELHGDVYAGQWASPTSAPAVLVPGTSLTLAEAQADLSVMLREYTGWLG